MKQPSHRKEPLQLSILHRPENLLPFLFLSGRLKTRYFLKKVDLGFHAFNKMVSRTKTRGFLSITVELLRTYLFLSLMRWSTAGKA